MMHDVPWLAGAAEPESLQTASPWRQRPNPGQDTRHHPSQPLGNEPSPRVSCPRARAGSNSAISYLRDNDDLASLCIHSLYDPRYCGIAEGKATHEPSVAHGCDTCIADGEEDVGLRLGAALRGDLKDEKQVPISSYRSSWARLICTWLRMEPLGGGGQGSYLHGGSNDQCHLSGY